jgi:hypothetical protein
MFTDANQSAERTMVPGLDEHQKEQLEYFNGQIEGKFDEITDNPQYREKLIRIAQHFAEQAAKSDTGEEKLYFLELLKNLPKRAKLFKSRSDLSTYIYNRSDENARAPLIAGRFQTDHFLLLAGLIYEQATVDNSPTPGMKKALARSDIDINSLPA